MTNVVAEKWNQAAEVPNFRRRFLANLEFARTFRHSLYLEGKSPFGLLGEAMQGVPQPRVLELAGGRGDFAIAMLEAGVAESVHVVDISDGALAAARNRATKRGVGGLTLELADINSYKIVDAYDAVVFSQSLHHIESLEGILGSAADALGSTGLLYVNDYIGQSRMQWTEVQMDLMNQILEILPASRRRMLATDGSATDVVKESIRRTPVETYLAVDPSEGVRSAEIDPVIRSLFSRVDYRPLGGAISYELFRLIAHHYADDEDAQAIVKLVLLMEKQLVDAGALHSDFAVYLCGN